MIQRWGHNELDDPTFTNPALYSVIHARRSVPDQYSDALIDEGVMSVDDRAAAVGAHQNMLNDHFNQIDSYIPERSNLKGVWSEMREPGRNITEWDTGIFKHVIIIAFEKRFFMIFFLFWMI